ncbi:MAG: chromosomal replication initiator protein DnaA [Clostridiales bacterium]|jgi:chromosomal replication initiator protein|nr:chromosomal replication initiator protein DnaA [Clostridiales bacterium]
MQNHNDIWARALESLASSMSQVSFDVWIKTLVPLGFVNKKLILVTPSISSQVLINKSYIDAVRSAVTSASASFSANLSDGDADADDVEIITETQKEEYLSKLNAEGGKGAVDGAIIAAAVDKKEDEYAQFVPKYTFDNFIVAESNRLVAAAASAVAKNPGSQYNPLFIYGGVGLGKTHIMHAIGNYIREHNPALKIICVPTEKFTNELIDSIRNSRDSRDNREFREKYRSADVLMMDDIQFLSGKAGTQMEVFHTFNDLYQSGKQIIMTSDKPPKEIAQLEERLRSRFLSGLIADIQPPDLETRVAILKRKALQEKYDIDPVVINFIAEKVTGNIREMEGLLSRVVFYSTLVGKCANNLALANEALKDYADVKNESITAYDVIDACCNCCNITKNEILGKKKTKDIVEPRQIAIYLITEMLPLPLISIGQLFGGRDHTTIIHARDKISQKIKTDPKIKAKVIDIQTYISDVKRPVS